MPNTYEMLPSLESLDKCVSKTCRRVSSEMMSHKYASSSSLSFHFHGSKCQNSCSASNLCFYISLKDHWQPLSLVYIVTHERSPLLFVLLAAQITALCPRGLRCRYMDNREDCVYRMDFPDMRISSSTPPTKNYSRWIPCRPTVIIAPRQDTINESARPCFVTCL
jgi:hypothetical protein